MVKRCLYVCAYVIIRLIVGLLSASEITNPIYVRRGDDVTLNCGNKSSPNISLVIWKTLRNGLVPANVTSNGFPEPMRLPNISFQDAGQYSCTAYTFESPLFNYSVEVIVKDVPEPPFNITVDSKSPTSLFVSWIFGENRNSPILLHTLYVYENDNLMAQQNVSTPLSSHLVSGLKPNRCYNIILRALNDVGWSILSERVLSMTPLGKIDFQPTIRVHNVSATSVVVLSDHSRLFARGSPNISDCKSLNSSNSLTSSWNYVVYVTSMDPISLVAKYVRPVNSEINQLITVPFLQPYTKYNVCVAFNNDPFESPSSVIIIRTAESFPDPPEFDSSAVTNNSITVRWEHMENIPGVLVWYKLELYRCGASHHTEPDESFRLRMQQLGAATKEFTFEALDANACYAIRIAAATSIGFGRFSDLYHVHTDIPAPLPPQLLSAKFLNSNNILLNWTCTGPCSSYSSQSFYVVCWSIVPGISQPPSCLRTQSADSSHPAFCDCDPTMKFHSTTLPWSIVQHPNSVRALFTVRSVRKRSTCEPRQTCERESLDSNMVYLDIKEVSGSKFDGAAVVSIVAICFFIISAVSFGACLASRLRCFSPNCHRSLFCPRTVEIPASKYRRAVPLRFNKNLYEPILASELHSHVTACHANNDAGFQAEFEAVEQSVCTADYTTIAAKLPENSSKNRYSNVLAYDHTRVVLKEPTHKSDYINANYIDGYHRRAAYIAAQGPTPATFDDFWLMVWEQACNVIVMISNFIERGRRKCDKYWPCNGQQLYGTVSVRTVSETVRAFFTIRVFAIRHVRCKRGTKERLVYHYQYTDWRDFDVPISPLPVLKFVEASVSHWTLEDGPIVVHCSAGVGRTGTYICIESLIRQLKLEKSVTIRGFLEHIRRQRMKLVQTEQQYAFIHDALREYVLSPCHTVKPVHFADYLARLRALDSSGQTMLEKQFELCVERDTADMSQSRTTTTRRRGSCSMFGSVTTELLGINASPLHGYHALSEYIVARHPLAGTEAEFWKMVWDENSSIVVCLSSSELPSFWPSKANEIRHIGWLHVSYAGHSPCGGSLSRFEFLLTSDREDYALPCTLWQLNDWSSADEQVLACSLLDLSSRILDDDDEELSEAHSSTGPIVVVDDVGGHRVGTFCALRMLINQFVHEFSFDVYFVFKMLCIQRPGMFQSYRDLEFIYTLLDHFLTGSREIPNHGDSGHRDSTLLNPYASPSATACRPNSHCRRRSKVNALFSHRPKSCARTESFSLGATTSTALLTSDPDSGTMIPSTIEDEQESPDQPEVPSAADVNGAVAHDAPRVNCSHRSDYLGPIGQTI